MPEIPVGLAGGITVAGTPPGTQSASQLWYDSANDVLTRWNGSGWQMADSASLFKGHRPAELQLADKVFMGQSGGFSPAFSGTGTTGSNSDTADFVLGTFAVKVTSNGAGAQAKIAGTFGTPLDLTGKQLVIWAKLENYASFLAGYPRVYLGDTGLANAYYWKITESAGQPWALDGEWIRITLPFGTATQVGSPARNSLAALTVQVFDASTGTVTVHLGGVATVTETAAWPNGVVSLCFDDGYAAQYAVARPYMDKYGFQGTQYLICEVLFNHAAYPGYVNLAQAQALEYFSGWHVASHAYTVANHNAGYTGIADAAALADMERCKEYLNANGFRSPEQFAYPLGNYGAQTLVSARRLFRSARSISQVGGFPDETFPPADYGRLRCQTLGSANTLASAEAIIDRAFANKQWAILTFHDLVTTATTNLQWPVASFQSLVDYISAKGIPVRTVGDVLNAG